MYNRLTQLPFKTLKTLNVLFVISLTLLPQVSHALASDAEQPVNISSDALEIDRNTGQSAYIGNVVIKQGTLEIKAGRVDILAPKNKIQTITAAGNPVSFKQVMDDGKNVNGEAKQMIYQVTPQRRIVLTGDARLIQDRDTFSSNRIEYQTDTGQLKAGNATAGSAPQTPEQRRAGRVNATFHPSSNKTP